MKNTTGKSAPKGENVSGSTEPHSSSGKAKSKNAIAHALYAGVVVPAAGESVEDYEHYRIAIRAAFQPFGAFQRTLVDRIAFLNWQIARVARYEAATIGHAVARSAIPPDPDTITGDGVEVSSRLPPSAPPAAKLARARALLPRLIDIRASCRAAIEALEEANDPLCFSAPELCRIVELICATLGYDMHETNTRYDECMKQWLKRRQLDGREFRSFVGEMIREAKKDTEETLLKMRDSLAQEVARQDRAIAYIEAEEQHAADTLRQVRERMFGASLFADAAVGDRIQRREAHLTQQLKETVAMLKLIRGDNVHSVAKGLSSVVGGLSRRLKDQSMALGFDSTGDSGPRE